MRLFGTGRFAQDFTVGDHQGIGGQDHLIGGDRAPHSASLDRGDAECADERFWKQMGVFVDIGRRGAPTQAE